MSAAINFINTGTQPVTKHPGWWFIRVKPYAPAIGARTKTIYLRKLKLGFDEKHGWYTHQLGLSAVKTLVEQRNNSSNPDSPRVFDVCTWEEASAIDRAAQIKVKSQTGRRTADDAMDKTGVMTTADLPNVHAAPQPKAAAVRRLPKPSLREPPTPTPIPEEPTVDEYTFEDGDGDIVDFDEDDESQGD